jgi:hypothetical protein
MAKHIVFRIIAGLVLLTAIAGIAFFAYQAGTMHSAAANIQLPVEDGLRYFPHFGMFPFFGFGCFIPLFVLFLVCLAFGSMRRMIWGPRWGWRHMHNHTEHSAWKHGPWGEGVPPFFAEWHKRAHEAPQPSEEKKSGE